MGLCERRAQTTIAFSVVGAWCCERRPEFALTRPHGVQMAKAARAEVRAKQQEEPQRKVLCDVAESDEENQPSWVHF